MKTVDKLFKYGGGASYTETELDDICGEIESLRAQLADAEKERDAWLSAIGEIASQVPIPSMLEATGTVSDLVDYLKNATARYKDAEKQLAGAQSGEAVGSVITVTRIGSVINLDLPIGKLVYTSPPAAKVPEALINLLEAIDHHYPDSPEFAEAYGIAKEFAAAQEGENYES